MSNFQRGGRKKLAYWPGTALPSTANQRLPRVILLVLLLLACVQYVQKSALVRGRVVAVTQWYDGLRDVELMVGSTTTEYALDLPASVEVRCGDWLQGELQPGKPAVLLPTLAHVVVMSRHLSPREIELLGEDAAAAREQGRR